MTTPRKEEILAKATAMWFEDQIRHGIVNPTNPEENELRESGFVSLAISELMRDNYKHAIESKDYDSGNFADFQFDVEEAIKTCVFTSGSRSSGKTNLNFLIAEKLMEKDVIVYAIDASQAWRHSPIQQVKQIRQNEEFTFCDGDAKRCTSVFDVSMLTYPLRIEFVEKVCKLVLDGRKIRSHRPNLFIFFEECHLYFPEGSMRSMKNRSNAVELATNGRNYNIAFGAITQFASMCDKLLVKLSEQRYFGRTSEPNDRNYIAEIIGADRAKELAKLQVGEFMYSYPSKLNDVQRIKCEQWIPKKEVNALETIKR